MRQRKIVSRTDGPVHGGWRANRALASLFAASISSGCHASAPVSPLQTNNAHACTEIVGPANLVLSFDGGKTVVQSRSSRPLFDQVSALVSLGKPLELAAIIDHHLREGGWRELFVSSDGGCRWESHGKTSAHRMVEGHDGAAYSWGEGLFRVTNTGEAQIPVPANNIVGVALDTSGAKRLRVVARVASGARIAVFDSTDAGSSWKVRAEVEAKPRLGDARYEGIVGFSFDPHDIDRMLLLTGARTDEARSTRDGGRTWVSLRGCESCVDATFDADGAVFALGTTYSPTLLFRSEDGARFSPVTAPGLRDAVGFIRAGSGLDGLAIVSLHAVHTGEVRTSSWHTQELPLETPDPPIEEQIERATFVPGAKGVLCIGIDRWKSFPSMTGTDDSREPRDGRRAL